ncbi:MAG: phosphoenolpyruvate--protein phosphotransferase [Chlamydiales bacterium]|nr:phosphoenolpyruvate--protein phosphotransferase [Chlamydiia bacterium]MCP5507589.1 phosphoenolpyruvate--protein phosphotransferase [Chlamydiales bacterium]
MSRTATEILLTGEAICQGIAIGRIYIYDRNARTNTPEFDLREHQIDAEIERFQKALKKTRAEILSLIKQLKVDATDEAVAILETHLQILDDHHLSHSVEQEIRHSRKNAEYVFCHAIIEIQKRFDLIHDSFFRERFCDIQDVANRIMGNLHAEIKHTLTNIPHDSIVFAEELTASDTAEAKASLISAFVTCKGGATSHAAIVARAKGIPYVSSVMITEEISDNDHIVIVDGYNGKVIINPSDVTIAHYKKIREQISKEFAQLQSSNKFPAETFDGYQIQLSANVEMINDLDLVRKQGSGGIGLFRSEYIFLSSNNVPSENEQYQIYKKLIKKMDGLPIVIRTFDIGGDKQLPANNELKLINPFVGNRTMHFLLKEKKLLKTQLRAIVRASKYGSTSILFPMVTSLCELKQAKALLNEVMKELEYEKKEFDSNIRVGCMIEVPSAAIISDLLAQECDFLSIGTNDLVQYSLAVDRSSHHEHSSMLPTHPCVIRLIRLIVTEANLHGIPVSVCGEVAADPRYTPLLLGLGVHELSLSSRYIPVIKNAIRRCSIVAASRLADKALALDSAEEIMNLISNEYAESNAAL